jgi:hypothetical protein
MALKKSLHVVRKIKTFLLDGFSNAMLKLSANVKQYAQDLALKP